MGEGLCHMWGDSPKIDLLRVQFQSRHVCKTSLPILIIHCDEMDSSLGLQDILQNDNNSIVVDMCNNNTSIKTQLNVDNDYIGNISPISNLNQLKLQGYYCKPAGMVVSPFRHTMLIDTDTIWFQSP